jgi:hypothetical protein
MRGRSLRLVMLTFMPNPFPYKNLLPIALIVVYALQSQMTLRQHCVAICFVTGAGL